MCRLARHPDWRGDQAGFDMQKLSISRASVPLAQEGMRLLTFAPET
jgi:hypothetical protein